MAGTRKGRVRSERTRRLSAGLALHEAALDAMPVGLCTVDAEQRVLLFNRRFLTMYNLSPEVVKPGVSMRTVLEHSADRGNMAHASVDAVFRRRLERMAARKPFSQRQQLPSGATIALEFRPLPEGGWVTLYEDVTERQRIEYELRLQIERFDQAIGNMSHGLAMYGVDERLIVCNTQFLDIYGLDPEVVKPGVSHRDVLEHWLSRGGQPHQSIDTLHAERMQALSAGTAVMRTMLSDGRVIQVSSRMTPDGGWVSAHEDVTAAEQAKRKLFEQNMLFDAALNNMAHGLCMLDADLRYIVWNQRYLEIFRYPPNTVRVGMHIREALEESIALGNHAGMTVDALYAEYLERLKAGNYTQLRQLSDGRVIKIAHRPMAQGGWVATYEDVTERHKAEQSIAHMARHDALTDLPNRVLFREKMDEGLARVEAAGEAMAVLCLDLDNFKGVNDTLGHPVGDRLLRVVAERLARAVGENDTIARLGGDEFAILQGASAPHRAEALGRQIVTLLGQPVMIDGNEINTSVSIGIAMAPSDGTTGDHLLKCADLALYRAKAEGRNTYRFFEPDMGARIQARRMLELDLRHALQAGEFNLVYQPQVNLATNAITGMEALLRWSPAERGPVPPSEFIPLAEETGLIVPLGEWVLRHACAEAARWPGAVRLAVNLSPVQFRNRGLVTTVTQVLAATGLAPQRLELEITEAALLQDDETVHGMLHQLRAVGVRISMDDFGTGYSSLSYLRSFPFDKIKIDRSFIADLDRNRDSAAIIRAVAELGASLGIETTAEGIETAEQLELVRRAGCTEMQGYLVSKPRPASDIADLLARARRDSAAA